MRRLVLACLLCAVAFLPIRAQVAMLGSGIPQGVGSYQGPCDVAAGCVAAHSVTRRLLASYAGNLFQLSRTGGGGGTTNIGQSGNVVNSAAITTFCGVNNANNCSISAIYDHTGNGHTLLPVHCNVPLTFDSGGLPMVQTGALINDGTSPCYFNDATGGTPAHGVDASMYAVMTDGAIPNNGACGSYGLFHAISDTPFDTPGRDLGLGFRQNVAGHRELEFDLEETVAGL